MAPLQEKPIYYQPRELIGHGSKRLNTVRFTSYPNYIFLDPT